METAASSSYFVRSRGRTTGPFDLATLQQLARRGRVSRFDQVSTDRTLWWPAGDLPGVFVASRRGGGGVTTSGALDADEQGPVALADETDDAAERANVSTRAAGGPIAYATRLREGARPPSVVAAQNAAKVTYFVAAGLILLLGLLPMAVVDGAPLWWWDGDASMIAGTVYALGAALTLLVVTPLTARLVRPLIAVSLIGGPIFMGFCVSLVRAIDAGGSAPLIAFAAWGLLVLPAILAVVNRLRPHLARGGPPSMRVLHVLLGAAVVFCAATGITLAMLAASRFGLPTRGPLLASTIFIGLGVVAMLGSGLFAVIAGKPRFSSSLTGASTISIVIASALFALAALFVIGDIRWTKLVGDNAAAVTYVIVRSIILFTAAIAWLSGSVTELLAWLYRRSARDARS